MNCSRLSETTHTNANEPEEGGSRRRKTETVMCASATRTLGTGHRTHNIGRRAQDVDAGPSARRSSDRHPTRSSCPKLGSQNTELEAGCGQDAEISRLPLLLPLPLPENVKRTWQHTANGHKIS
ncbi:uncharacterized protein LOC116804873 [Drosophila mojavensis]|uniref:uncharacterized protein LOC116804873 n=1 Tax=Drosophila mojavensis TaxID=7230 RepID=UPI0013EE5FD3|nr:uncharacterized protein LOC116804873 [Drosophila mojavensis]